MEISGNLIAMLLGIGSSATLHISQALMRMGVVQLRAGNRGWRTMVLYGSGLGLNFTAPLWVMLANLFADTLWFTSMFASGLVALLLFNAVILRQPVGKSQIVGAGALVVGTLLIASAGFVGSSGERVEFGLSLLLTVSLVWLILMPALGMMVRRSALSLQESIFGLAAGGFLALDALWKALSQRQLDGSVALLPDSPAGWLLLAVSFGGAAGAFLMMQWSYWRHCRADQVVIGYNLMYVALPLSLVGLVTVLDGGLPWNPLIMVGLLVMVTGAMLASRQASVVATQHPGRA